MIQIILAIVIVLIGIAIFMAYPVKSNVKEMTLGALLVILAIILKRLSIVIPFFGFPSLKVTFEVLPLIIAGLILQPGYCFIVAILTDGLGLVFANTGAPFFGFTLNAILQTMIPCFAMNVLKKRYDAILEKVVKYTLGVIGVIGILYFLTLQSVTMSSQVYQMTMPLKLALVALVMIMLIVIFVVMSYYRRRIDKEKYNQLIVVIFSVVFIDLIITLTLTPYWLQTMYGIPFFASSFIRMIKECVMIPINIVIVYLIYSAIIKFLKLD